VNPKNISGLTLWLDAADDSTVNNGRVTNGQNVFKIVDKASGYVFRNGYGVSGPSYSFGVVNGKNAITFNYYTSPDTILAKGLWAGGLTPMTSGTYSLYCVSFPYDDRQRNQRGDGTFIYQSLWLLSLANSLPTSLPTSGDTYIPHRSLFFRSIGNSTPNQPSLFGEDISGQVGVYGATGLGNTSLFDRVNQLTPGVQSLPQSDSKYVFGKTNIVGVRASDGAKKLTVIRTNYISNESFAFNSTNRFVRSPPQGFPPNPASGGGPWLTIGAILPNPLSRSVEGIPGPMPNELVLISPDNFNVWAFEGHFCEFLFFDRVLERSEANSIEEYLTKKWIG